MAILGWVYSFFIETAALPTTIYESYFFRYFRKRLSHVRRQLSREHNSKLIVATKRWRRG